MIYLFTSTLTSLQRLAIPIRLSSANLPSARSQQHWIPCEDSSCSKSADFVGEPQQNKKSGYDELSINHFIVELQKYIYLKYLKLYKSLIWYKEFVICTLISLPVYLFLDQMKYFDVSLTMEHFCVQIGSSMVWMFLCFLRHLFRLVD